MKSLTELGLLEVVVYGFSPGMAHAVEVERFVSPCVPRKGERINIQGDDLKIYRVEWFIAEHVPTVHVFIDMESAP